MYHPATSTGSTLRFLHWLWYAPSEETVKFLKALVDKPLNEKHKAKANKFALLSCDPAHPPKLDDSVTCLVPKAENQMTGSSADCSSSAWIEWVP